MIVDGLSQELEQQGQANIGTIAVNEPGKYQIGARVADEFVALSDEYTIEIVADEKPTIEIRKPGRDWRATSIEAAPVAFLIVLCVTMTILASSVMEYLEGTVQWLEDPSAYIQAVIPSAEVAL